MDQINVIIVAAVIAVVDRLKAAGLERLSIATRRP